jgi:hypothetical protein
MVAREISVQLVVSVNIDDLVARTLTALQNSWQDRPMTTGEEVAVNLAVRFVVEQFSRKPL